MLATTTPSELIAFLANYTRAHSYSPLLEVLTKYLTQPLGYALI